MNGLQTPERQSFLLSGVITIKNLLMHLLVIVSLFASSFQAGFFWHLDRSDSSMLFPTESSSEMNLWKLLLHKALQFPLLTFSPLSFYANFTMLRADTLHIVLSASSAAPGARHCTNTNQK